MLNVRVGLTVAVGFLVLIACAKAEPATIEIAATTPTASVTDRTLRMP
jgi:hypothetical protein